MQLSKVNVIVSSDDEQGDLSKVLDSNKYVFG